MTTLNARANAAWLEEIALEPTDNDAGFSHQRGAFETGWEAGFKAATEDMAGLLRILRSEAITSERKSAYDRAIEAVEGLS